MHRLLSYQYAKMQMDGQTDRRTGDFSVLYSSVMSDQKCNFCAKHNQHAYHANARGLGHSTLENESSEIEFESIVGS